MAVGLDSTLNSLGLSRTFVDQLSRSLQARSTGRVANTDAVLYAQYAAMGQGNAGSASGAMSRSGWVPSPAESAESAGDRQVVGNGFGGVNLPGAFGVNPQMQSVQNALAGNPEFRQQFEQVVRGNVVGATDAGLTVWRPNAAAQTLGRTTRGLMAQPPKAGSIQHSLGSSGVPITPQNLASPQGGMLRGLQQLEANIMGFVTGMSAQKGGLSPDVLAAAQKAGINTQNPQFEDLVFLNMMSYTTDKEADIMTKVNQLGQEAGANPQSLTQDGFYGGLTAGVGGATARALGVDIPTDALVQLLGAAAQEQMATGVQARTAGGVQARTAGNVQASTGLPATGVKQVVDTKGNVVDPSSMSETAKQQMLQKLMGDLQKLYEMLSNMSKSMHDMQKAAINNIR